MNREPQHSSAPRAGLWLPALLVALGAAAVTAHGLFEVARGAGIPAGLAAVYPLITDGLALVAYAATTQLTGGARRYAWTVVVLAAGLSGLAQASYLADAAPTAATDAPTPAALRFGVGAWPAIAAAIVAHLLFLIATPDRKTAPPQPAGSHADNGLSAADDPAVLDTDPSTEATVQLPAVQPEPEHPRVEQPDVQHAAVEHRAPLPPLNSSPSLDTAELDGVPDEQAGSAGERAREVAERYAAEHGQLPTVSRLKHLAGVSRGTAHNALKPLRERPAGLHIVHSTDDHRHLR